METVRPSSHDAHAPLGDRDPMHSLMGIYPAMKDGRLLGYVVIGETSGLAQLRQAIDDVLSGHTESKLRLSGGDLLNYELIVKRFAI